MDKLTSVSSLEDIKVWIAEHDGRTNAYWEAQHKWDSEMASCMKELKDRLTAVEKKVFFISGMASAIGAIAGTLLTTF